MVVKIIVICIYIDAGNVLEGAECGGTTGDVCDATVSNLNCGVEDCYKCRCATGYTWNSGTSACDTSSGIPSSRKHLRTKVTPDLHLTYSKNGGNLGLVSKR